MEEKKIGLAMMVPALWVSTIVFFVVYTLASPVLFFLALFSPYTGPVDFIENMLNDLL